jgi:hypothetical protein
MTNTLAYYDNNELRGNKVFNIWSLVQIRLMYLDPM